MADNKSPGGISGDENKKIGSISAEKANNGKTTKPVNEKPNAARLNAKRRRQRKKFSEALKVEKKQRESVRSGDDVSPRPAFAGDLRSRDDQKVSHGNESQRPKKTGEKPAKPTEPIEKDEPKVETVEQPVELVEQQSEPAGPVEPDVPEETRDSMPSVPESEKTPEDKEPRGITYFSHPFSEPDERVNPDVKMGSDDASEEEDIIIGKEETNIPIPVGRIKEVAEEERHEELPVVEVKEEVPDEKDAMVQKEDREKDREEQLEEKASAGKVLKSWLLMVWPKITAGGGNFLSGAGKNLWGGLSQLNVGRVMSCLALVLVLGGGVYAYSQKLHEKAYSYVAGLITPKPVEKVEVEVNPRDQRMFGIISTSIFGKNAGSVNDLVPEQIIVATHFGMLMEPKVQGETGITALTYFGALKDGADTINQFVVYLENLEEIQNLYKTDVYAMLDRSTERDRVLLDYLEKLKVAREKSGVLQTQIRVNVDDFTRSYNSLTPDKSKYEQDFFTAMENLLPEKSDLLLKGFIDITQKQAALKARVSALSRLEEYYESALEKLDRRILAVEQNRDALIQGIKVVDIPGADLNIIIKSGQN